MGKLVGIDERGNRVGEDHPGARLSDLQIDEIRQAHEDGVAGYRQLAKRFGCGKSTIRDIVKLRRRFAAAVRWKSARPAPKE